MLPGQRRREQRGAKGRIGHRWCCGPPRIGWPTQRWGVKPNHGQRGRPGSCSAAQGRRKAPRCRRRCRLAVRNKKPFVQGRRNHSALLSTPSRKQELSSDFLKAFHLFSPSFSSLESIPLPTGPPQDRSGRPRTAPTPQGLSRGLCPKGLLTLKRRRNPPRFARIFFFFR